MRDGPAHVDAVLHGQHGQLDSRVDVELEVDVLEMGVHGVAGEAELPGDSAVGHPPSHAGGHAQLGVGERRPAVVRSLLAVRTCLGCGPSSDCHECRAGLGTFLDLQDDGLAQRQPQLDGERGSRVKQGVCGQFAHDRLDNAHQQGEVVFSEHLGDATTSLTDTQGVHHELALMGPRHRRGHGTPVFESAQAPRPTTVRGLGICRCRCFRWRPALRRMQEQCRPPRSLGRSARAGSPSYAASACFSRRTGSGNVSLFS
jgi:hypothetical protein